jgi:hypothetical protein
LFKRATTKKKKKVIKFEQHHFSNFNNENCFLQNLQEKVRTFEPIIKSFLKFEDDVVQIL